MSGLMQITDYRTEVGSLWDVLMGLEMQLVDQLEETIKDFERNITDMMSSFVESVQGLYLLFIVDEKKMFSLRFQFENS